MSPAGLGEYYQEVVNSSLYAGFCFYYILAFIFFFILNFRHVGNTIYLGDAIVILGVSLLSPIVAPIFIVFVYITSVFSRIDIVLWRRK